jgi:MFS family permease
MVFSAFLSQFFVETAGRKKILLISSGGLIISLTTMGLYFFLNERNLIKNLGWIPIIALVSFILSYCFGFGPIPYTMMGEMFAPEIKSLACSLAVSLSWVVDFFITKSFLPVEAYVGNYGNFWIFAVLSVFGFIFTKKKVFETKGLSLMEIQNRLNGRTRIDRNIS